MDSPSGNSEFDTVSANRQIKDGVFRLLFDDTERATELYYALTDDKCSPDEIMIITITTVVSGKMKNDLAFVVRGKVLIVGEHMPIRILMYTGQLYDKMVQDEGRGEISVRWYAVQNSNSRVSGFHNGEAARPEKETLRLSSAYAYVSDNKLEAMQ